jgi:hypothetical protein
VLVGPTLHGEPRARDDLHERVVELGSLGEHHLAVRRADVVEVDVDRESRQIEDEEIERGAAFEHDARAEERMRRQLVQESNEHPDLLERVERESGFGRDPLKLFSGEHHRTSTWFDRRRGSMVPPRREAR